MNSKLKYKNKIYILLFLFLFFFTSLQIDYDLNQKQVYNPNIQKVIREIPLNFNFSRIEEIYAANEHHWEGIRAVISLVRNITISIDALLLSFKKSGLLNLSGTSTTNNGIFKIKIVMNDPKTISLSAGGTKEYSNRLIIWNANSNAKYLELYFDDPEVESSDGAVVTIEPAVMNSYLYNTGKRMECYTNKQIKTMICSWEGKLDKLNGISEKAQVIIRELNGEIIVNGLVKTDSTTSETIGSNLRTCNQIDSSRYYYTLLAIIKNTYPYYTTAAFGIKRDSKSLDRGSCTNPYNYGYFNVNANPNAGDSTRYFASIGETPPSSLYPATSEVSSLLTQEPTKSTVDTIVVNFKSTDTAP